MPDRPLNLELTLQVATAPAWLERVQDDFDSFLKDHASCEKKASGMALSIASHYPDRPRLLNAMAELAVEELSHYREVVRLLTRRGSQPGPDRKDRYVNELNKCVRREPHYLVDRLLLAAVIERRGHERFGLIAEALEPGAERRFFRSITQSEGRHYRTFLDLAATYHSQTDLAQTDLAQTDLAEEDLSERIHELCSREAEILVGLPLGPHLH